MANTVSFKLSNILLQPTSFTSAYPAMYWRVSEASQFSAGKDSLSFVGAVNFNTYFNVFSIAKWKRYTVAKSFGLHIEAKGDFSVVFQSGCAVTPVLTCLPTVLPRVRITTISQVESAGATEESDTIVCSQLEDGYIGYDIALPDTDEVLLSFKLVSAEGVSIRHCYYYANVEPEAIRPVKLALSTTTFKKEDYITPNIAIFEKEVAHGTDAIAGNCHLVVVDNGKTLDAAALTSKDVTVIPNRNAGGAGGFARGMIEVQENLPDYTHILLMDDDVKFMPESFIRTFNLLSILNDEYKDAHVSGAMLAMEKPSKQLEDVAFVNPTGYYRSAKGEINVTNFTALVYNDSIETVVPDAYGAWWFHCIPMNRVRELGLPLPLFVRCDDVEYGMRANPAILAMNGICIWHEDFADRNIGFSAYYQHMRNFPILMAVDGKCNEALFALRSKRQVYNALRALNYNGAEQMIRGLEDFLKGPEFLESYDPQAILKEIGALNEKLVPLEQLDSEVISQLDTTIAYTQRYTYRSKLRKVLECLPYDHHYLPLSWHKDTPAPIGYFDGLYPGPEARWCKTYVALNSDATMGAIRTIDKSRFKAMRARLKTVMTDYRHNVGEVQQQYRDAMPRLTSVAFWKQYLQKGD